MESIDYKVEIIVEQARKHLEGGDNKHFVNLEEFLLIAREIIEDCKGKLDLNGMQFGRMGYIQEAVYKGITFITITDEKLNRFYQQNKENI